MFALFKKIADSEMFQSAILFVILINALFLGLETYPTILEQYDKLIVPVLVWSQILFVIEIIIRFLSYGPKKYTNFFGDFWNRFDFTIVALSLLPVIGGFITIARVLRVLRILRILSVSDKMRDYLNNLKTTFAPVCMSVSVYLVFTYIISLIGHYMFGVVDVTHWGTLHDAFISVVFMSLFQDVGEIFGSILRVNPLAIFFIIFFYIVELVIIGKLLEITLKTDELPRNKK